MLSRPISLTLRLCARKLHVDYICAGIPAPYHRNRGLIHGKNRVIKCGDDAGLAMADKRGNIALGIADGVGGWRQHGFDAGYVSLGLLTECQHLVSTGSWGADSPVRWIDNAHKRLLKNGDKNILGSSTVCLCGIDMKTANLYAANIGDSGLLVITSSGDIRLKTSSLQVEFNAPLQIGSPAHIAEHYAKASDSEFFTTKLQAGDYVILMTDGVSDNIDDEKMCEFFMDQKDSLGSLEDLSAKLVKHVLKLSESETHESPFAKKAKVAGYEYSGGKPDDISLVLLHAKG